MTTERYGFQHVPTSRSGGQFIRCQLKCRFLTVLDCHERASEKYNVFLKLVRLCTLI